MSTMPPSPARKRRSHKALIIAVIAALGVLTVAAGTYLFLDSREQRYQSAEQIVDALDGAGLGCQKWADIEDWAGGTGASCSLGDGELIIGTYRDADDAARQAQSMSDSAQGRTEIHLIVGSNWTINCGVPDLCRRIERDFGGEYVFRPAG